MSVDQTTHLPTTAQQLPRAWTLRRTFDLLLIMGLALALPGLALLPFPLLRVPLGLIAVLFAPGYAFTALVFPRRNDLDDHARIALSFGLSIAFIPIVALLLNALPWGIQPVSIVFASSIWMLVLSSIALWQRRQAASSEENYVPPMAHPVRAWQSLGNRVKIFYIIGTCILLSLTIGTVLSVLLPDPTSRMTEFYMLGSEGLAENYPREIAVGQDMPVQLGINNHEGAMAQYHIEAASEGQILFQVNRITLEDGASWEGAVYYSLSRVGDNQRIDILLFHNDDSKPYRQLQLWTNVRR